MSKADDPRYDTTDGQPPREGWEHREAPAPEREDGQHEAYWILSDEERAKGFVRPVRRSYYHADGCDGTTTMNQKLAETIAREPDFYGATFCAHCHDHYPISEFRWLDDDTVMGS